MQRVYWWSPACSRITYINLMLLQMKPQTDIEFLSPLTIFFKAYKCICCHMNYQALFTFACTDGAKRSLVLNELLCRICAVCAYCWPINIDSKIVAHEICLNFNNTIA